MLDDAPVALVVTDVETELEPVVMVTTGVDDEVLVLVAEVLDVELLLITLDP